MAADDAFVESDKFRRAVFAELVAGETDPKRIAKKHRLIPQAADRALSELIEHGLAEAADGGYRLTPEGERFEEQRRRRDLTL